MRERGVDAVAMEVSSHALVLGRVDGLVVDVAVFTNLGQDHLDFHADLEDYFAAKASLFTPARAAAGGGLASTTRYGDRLAGSARRRAAGDHRRHPDAAGAEPATCWSGRCARPPAPTGRPSSWPGSDGVRRSPSRSALPGGFNVANAALALAALAPAAVSTSRRRPAGWPAAGCPGRMELVERRANRSSPWSTSRTRPTRRRGAGHGAARCATDGGRLITVLGCGGDRDRAKRPVMGAVAAAARRRRSS